ncbi:MAG: hypothetical protein ACRDTB_19200 [Actinophytocola sp.]
MKVLRAESHQHAMQNLEQRRERQVQEQRERLARLRMTTQWQTRPHGRLTETELTSSIRHAEQQQAAHREAAERTRERLAEREPAVEAGRGPRVTKLDTELHRLRVNAERQGTVEAIQRRWQAARTQAGDAAERAAHKEFDAERTRWWQTGRREQLQAEAAADQAASQRAADQADELARHAAELQRQLGGPTVWRHAQQHLERAEASNAQDRHRAHQADQSELAQLRDRVTSQDTAALDAGTRRDELLAEQQLRDTMPEVQATFEHQLRTDAIERQQLHGQGALERQLDQSLQMDLDYQQRTVQADIHRDVDRDGPGLGL